MGVVVQRMVDARAAGVLFTLNPLNGDRSKVMIEASFGLGEAVVAGEVNPDRYLVDKVTFELLERTVARKDVQYRFDPAAGTAVRASVPRARQEQPCLSDAEVVALAAARKACRAACRLATGRRVGGRCRGAGERVADAPRERVEPPRRRSRRRAEGQRRRLRAREPAGARQPMKPAPFSYRRAETVDEAIALLAEWGEEGRVARGRSEPRAAPEHAACQTRLPDRHQSDLGACLHRLAERRRCGRRADAPCRARVVDDDRAARSAPRRMRPLGR